MSTRNLRQLLAPSLLGLKRNLLPGLVLQACALLIVIGYFYVPSVQALFNEIGEIKNRYGYGFSALSTAFFGGVIPFIVLFFMGGISKSKAFYELLFFAGFWCWKGVEVDAFYRLQAVIFGNENDVATIAMKTAVDQLIYNSLWASPTQVVFFLWKDGGFSWSQFKENLKLIPLRRRVIALLFSGWMVWIPTVMIVYSLPVALQIPLFNVVLCFWCLLVSFVVKTTSSS